MPIYVGFLSELLYEGATYEDCSGFAFHEVQTEADITAALSAMISQGTDFIKSTLSYSERLDEGYREGLDPDLLPFLVRSAQASGMTVSLHVDSADDFRQGVVAEVDEIAHIPGYLWGRGDQPTDHLLMEADAHRAAEKGIAVVTTTHSRSANRLFHDGL